MNTPLSHSQALELTNASTEVVSGSVEQVSPLVSISMVTFNHEKFIAQAIESVLMQKTNFAYELIIGEDLSSDSTREIVMGYQQKHPDKIKVLLSTENLGSHTQDGCLNFFRTIRACRGNYIALLDGDDFWTDDRKLQKQVDAMVAQPLVSICSHNSFRQIDAENGRLEAMFEEGPRNFTIPDYILLKFPTTCSAMIKNVEWGEFPDYFFSGHAADWALYLMILQEGGEIAYLPENMSVWRIHSGGVHSGANRLAWALGELRSFALAEKMFHGAYTSDIRAHVAQWGWVKLWERHQEESNEDLETNVEALLELAGKLPKDFELSTTYNKLIRVKVAEMALWKSFALKDKKLARRSFKLLIGLKPAHVFSSDGRRQFLKIVNL